MQWTLPLIPISCIYPDTIPVYPALMDFIYFSVLYNLNPISSLHSVFIFSVSCLYLLCIMFIYILCIMSIFSGMFMYSLYHVCIFFVSCLSSLVCLYFLYHLYIFSVSCLIIFIICITSSLSLMELSLCHKLKLSYTLIFAT